MVPDEKIRRLLDIVALIIELAVAIFELLTLPQY